MARKMLSRRGTHGNLGRVAGPGIEAFAAIRSSMTAIPERPVT
ncbi:MAG TPA: hypothetical protein VGV87_05335 [Blastocatellia bacterium]|nr:hypothetical protein [Blastocatellia bacterium]